VAWLGATIGGWIGWWLGSFIGLTTAFMASAVGTAACLYVVRRVLDELIHS
jgi:membrane protein YqaA with SNARE-associated domain